MRRTIVRITVDGEGTHISIETDEGEAPPPPHDSQLDSMIEGADQPLGFRANVESDDGRY